MKQRSTGSEHTDAPELQGCLASDLESTADLQNDNTADLPPILQNAAPERMNSAALSETETTTPAVNPDVGSVNEPAKTDLRQINDPLPRLIPNQRAMGFFVFAACALVAMLFATERHTGTALPGAEFVLAASSTMSGNRSEPEVVGSISADSPGKPTLPETRVKRDAGAKRESARAKTSLGALVFESRSFATSEEAVAAVFIVNRTQVVRGRAIVQWVALSGSADAGIDFSDASGTARFADGQRQLAIYVPLRNDLLKEKDETFKVCLRSPRQARIAGKSCAEVTIRDDDVISSI